MQLSSYLSQHLLILMEKNFFLRIIINNKSLCKSARLKVGEKNLPWTAMLPYYLSLLLVY